MKSITPHHKKQFEEMKKSLVAIGAKEGNFIKVEILFYDAITVARTYGEDPSENPLLAAFKDLQANQYQDTKALFNKNTQRERVIRRFIGSFRTVLTAGIRNAFFQPQLA